MNNHFSVGIGDELVGLFLKVFAQLFVIVEFTVISDPSRFVCVRHWLMAEQGIDNGKPTVTQRDPVAHKKPLAVRTAMPNGIGHGFDLRTCWRLTAPTDDASYSAHSFKVAKTPRLASNLT